MLKLSQETAEEDEIRRNSTRQRGSRRGGPYAGTRNNGLGVGCGSGAGASKARKAAHDDQIDCDANDSSLEVISPKAGGEGAADDIVPGSGAGGGDGGGEGNDAGSAKQEGNEHDAAGYALLEGRFFEDGVGKGAGSKRVN